MGKFIVIVLDGFGVGSMEDAKVVRPSDVGSNTCVSILKACPELRLPNLERLGLINIVGDTASGAMKKSTQAMFGKIELAHFGADTFFGHQEIMGTKPVLPVGEAARDRLEDFYHALKNKGYDVRFHRASKEQLLVVENALTIADNIECDPGQAINLTAAIDVIPFERVVEIGQVVRGLTTVPRVIAFGGEGVSLENIIGAIEEKDNGYIGVNAPLSGVYRRGYRCVHLGYGVDATVQAASLIGALNIPVIFLGKVADVCQNPFGESYSIVDTEIVMSKTLEIVSSLENGFVCCNVQETDLAGHEQDIPKYADKLAIADSYIGKIIERLGDDDIMIVMADHGNDPAIGHNRHTRECVPLMVFRKGMYAKDLGIKKTLSDVGATACDYFSAKAPQNGRSFLSEVQK